jgi:precorrin-2 dehydrogenase/sirohydrochlorin ferrochelatase
MITFPLFINLSDKKCIIAGGGKVAERKVELLLHFQTQLTVIGPEISDYLCKLEQEGQITVNRKEFSVEDLAGAFLVIAATSERKVNESIFEYAITNGIWVNVVDCPEQCTFIFPAIVKRGGLVVGISTSGAYPALSKTIREKIETLLPESYGDALQTLKDIRKKVEWEISETGKRSKILTQITTMIDSLTTFSTDEILKTDIVNQYQDLKMPVKLKN